MMLHIKFQDICPLHVAPVKNILKAFTVWTRCPCKSCDKVRLNKLLFPQPSGVVHEIRLQLAQWLLSKCLKLSQYESPKSKVKTIRPLVLEKKTFKGCHHIWAWWPC